MPDFVQAREIRRLILGQIEQQQSTDSACAAKLKAVWIRVVEGSVNELDDFIALIYPGCSISPEKQQLYSVLFPTHSLDEWLSTQRKTNELEEECRRAKHLLDSAEVSYARIAPLGFFSTLGKADDDKRNIKLIKRERDTAQVEWLRVSAAFQTQKSRELNLLREILVEGMGSSMFNIFANTRPGLKALLEICATEWSTIWKGHLDRQIESLKAIRANCYKLEVLYQYTEAESKPKQLFAKDSI